MKKKLLLMVAMIAVLVCLFAISVSAEDNQSYANFEVTYSDGTTQTVYTTVSDNYQGFIDLKETVYTEPPKDSEGTYTAIDWSLVETIDFTNSKFYHLSNGTYTEKDGGTWANKTKLAAAVKWSDVTVFANVKKVITGNLTHLNGTVFKGWTGLTEVVISENLESIGYDCFRGTANLKTVDFSQNTQVTMGESQWIFAGTSIEEITFPDSVIYIGANTFNGCTKLKTVNFGNAVTKINESAFSGCTSLESITLPATLKTLGGSAFQGCTSLKNINLPDGIEKIAGNTFASCTSLTTITLPLGLTYIGNDAFNGCKALTEVVNLSNHPNISSMGNQVFMNCTSLGGELIIPKNMTTITHSYQKTAITYVYIHENVTKINDGTFSGCSNLAKVEFSPNINITSLGAGTFNSTAITSIDIPASVTDLTRALFENCNKLETVNFLSDTNLVSITGNNVFSNCSSLKKIQLPNSLTTWTGVGVFNNCTSLEEIRYGASLTQWPDSIMNGLKALKRVYLPATITSVGVKLLGYTNSKDSSNNITFIFTGTLEEAEAFRTLVETTDSQYSANSSKIYGATLVSASEYDPDTTEPSGFHFVYDYSICKAFYKANHIFATNNCLSDCARERCGLKNLVNENGEHNNIYIFSASNEDYIPASYTEMMYRICQCDICKTVCSVDDIGVLFTINGYSYTQGAIMQGFQINKEAIKNYNYYAENDIQYGIMAAAGSVVNLNIGTSFANGVVNVDFTNRAYDIMEMKIYNIGEGHYDTELYCCGYILVDGNIIYLDDGMEAGATMPSKVTYSKISQSVTQQVSLDMVVAKQGDEE